MNEPTVLDLCSGTGAFSIGFEAEGFRTIGFSEIDPFCCRLLKYRWPGVPNYGDLRQLPAIPCNVLVCGDPCQPFSDAGRKLGEADDRYIWPSVLAAIERCRPDWCVLENVVGSVNMVLARRIDDLEAIGYQSQPFDLPSCSIGLPSVERHVWLVATRNQVGLEGSTEAELSRVREQGEVFGHWWPIQPTDSREGVRRYLSASRNLRSRKGFPDYVDRIAAVGNAVPPPIVQVIARAIRALI